MTRFGAAEIQRARQAHLPNILERLGHKMTRKGSEWSVEENPGIRISGNRWYDHYAGRGGNTLDFLVGPLGIRFVEAVDVALGAGPLPAVEARPAVALPQERHFHLPPRNSDDWQVIDYLCRVRRLHRDLVLALVRDDLLYADQRHNAVFVCRDRQGVARGAYLRGTGDTPYKGAARGSDTTYGWHWATDTALPLVVLTESPIDVRVVI